MRTGSVSDARARAKTNWAKKEARPRVRRVEMKVGLLVRWTKMEAGPHKRWAEQEKWIEALGADHVGHKAGRRPSFRV